MHRKHRPSGISAVGELPWGTHFCHFYETEQDLLDIVIPYFKAGLDHHEHCLWVVAQPLTKKRARKALRQAVPDIDRHLEAGNIELVSHKRWYLEDGVFDVKRLINGWKQKLAEALAKGYVGMRANGKAAWVTWDDFEKYERELDKLIANQRLIVLCTYPLAETTANEVFDVARSHQLAIAKRHGNWDIVETPRLIQAKDEITRLNAELEQQVSQRTAEHVATNQELRNEIAERKRVDQELRTLNAALENAVEGIARLDTQGRYLSINPAYANMLGYQPEELLHRGWQCTVHPQDIEKVLAAHQRMLNDGRVEVEALGVRKDNTTFWKQLVMVNANDEKGQWSGHYCFMKDITERKRAEEALGEYAQRLQFLSRRVVEVQEEERRHLARELHDEIGQVLSAVSVTLQALKEKPDATGESRLEESINTVHRATEQVRNLSLDLRPLMLDDLGLVSTIRWYAAKQAQRSGFTLEFVVESSGARLPADMEIACYRVVQEALTNVVRHAQARQVRVEFRQREEDVELVIRDDGVGFKLDAVRRGAARGESYGVFGMRERVKLFGGQIEIESKSGQGTTIHVRFPISSTPLDPQQ